MTWASGDDLFTNAPQRAAAGAVATSANAGYGQYSDLATQGRAAATDSYGSGIDLYKNLIGSSQKGADAYGDATGVNGPEGLARAKASFTATPGYTEGINMTLDQNDRRAASRGMLGSGNTIADTTKLATDYANTKYGDFASRLQPFLGTNVAGTSGAAGLYGNLGNSLNTSFQNQGDAAAGTQNRIGTANATAENARAGAAGNLFNGLFGVANLGLRAAGAPNGNLFPSASFLNPNTPFNPTGA
jgi:hypothetical protein